VKKANIIISIILILFGAAYAYLTIQLPDRNLPNTLGSSFMPWILVISIEILSLSLLIINCVKGPGVACEVHTTKKELIGILIVVFIIIAYVKLMEYLGFLICTPLFIAGLMILSGSRKWHEIAFVSVIASVAIYFFFFKLFKVVLPMGNLF